MRWHNIYKKGTYGTANLVLFLKMNIDSLIGLAKVFQITSKQKITAEDINLLNIEPGDRILFKTANSEIDNEMAIFQEKYIYLSLEAANILAAKEVQTIGLDYSDIFNYPGGEQIQLLFAQANIRIIEGLKLAGIAEGTYDMMCLPVKSDNEVTSASRVILKPFAA